MGDVLSTRPKKVAAKEQISLGEALVALVRRGLQAPELIDQSTPFPCFALSPDAEPITLEQTLAAEDLL